MAALKASEAPTPAPAPAQDGKTTTPAAPPAATPGSVDPRTPPIAAAPDPDADLSTPVVGPIPPDRHKKILERTREKVAQETRAAFEQEHGDWLKLKTQFTPEEFSTIIPTLKNISHNPMQFMHDVARDMGMQLVPLGQPGQNGAQRPTSPPGQPQAQEPQPDIAVTLDNGQIAHTYSAEQLQQWKQWVLGQVKGDLSKELQPFRDYQQQQEYQAFMGTIEQRAQSDFEDVAKNEAFDELRPHIAAIMRSDKRYTLDKAYNRAYREHFFPTRDAKIHQRVLDEQNQKARAASSSLTPTRRTTAESGPTGSRTTLDLVKENAARLGIQ